jgi:DNA-binding response OmpR family regulator
MNAPLPSGHFAGPKGEGPRFRDAGELTLDRFHRDGRVDDLWVGLLPDQFALLWRLAAHPGERLTGQQLLAEIWPLAADEAEQGYIAAQIAAMRGKLAVAGVAYLICTDGEGRFFVEVPALPGLSRVTAG